MSINVRIMGLKMCNMAMQILRSGYTMLLVVLGFSPLVYVPTTPVVCVKIMMVIYR